MFDVFVNYYLFLLFCWTVVGLDLAFHSLTHKEPYLWLFNETVLNKTLRSTVQWNVK